MAYEQLKTRVMRLYPSTESIKVKLPDWLQDADYVEPVFDGRVIKPKGFLALQKDGSVKYES